MPECHGRPKEGHRKLSIRRKSLYALITTLVFVGLVESALRLLCIEPRERGDPPVVFVGAPFHGRFPLAWDDDIFWRMENGATIPDTDESLNDRGFRGPQVAQEKSRGVRRVLFVGDSNTFGIGVAHDATFSSRLHRWLGTSNDSSWEAINAGVPGYSVFQMARWLEKEGLALDADLVVIYPGAWNDFTPCIEADDETQAWRIDDARTWIDASRIVRILKSLRAADEAKRTRDEEYRRRVNKAYSERAERPDGARVPREAFRRLLERAVIMAGNAGARVLLVVPPAPLATRMRFPEGEVYADIVRLVARVNSIGLVDARAAFAAYPEPEEKARFCDIIHPSVHGHAEIAYMIASALSRAGIDGVPPAPAYDPASPRIDLRESLAKLTVEESLLPEPADVLGGIQANPDALVLPSPSRLRFDALDIPPEASLTFGIARADANAAPSDPGARAPRVRVRVSASIPGADPKELYVEDFGPTSELTSQPRHRRVDLRGFGGRRITLWLESVGSEARIVWSDAVIDPYR